MPRSFNVGSSWTRGVVCGSFELLGSEDESSDFLCSRRKLFCPEFALYEEGDVSCWIDRPPRYWELPAVLEYDAASIDEQEQRERESPFDDIQWNQTSGSAWLSALDLDSHPHDSDGIGAVVRPTTLEGETSSRVGEWLLALEMDSQPYDDEVIGAVVSPNALQDETSSHAIAVGAVDNIAAHITNGPNSWIAGQPFEAASHACGYCDQQLHSQDQLFSHMLTVHPPPAKYTCETCGQTFTARKSLLRHIRTTHRPKNFSCSYCQVKFARKDTRDRHQIEQHSETDRTVVCVRCRRYVTKRALAEHLDSEVCRRSDSLRQIDSPTMPKIQFLGPDNDPFLAAIRMLRLFEASGESEMRNFFRLRLTPRAHEQSQQIRFESTVTKLLIDRLTEQRAASKALAFAALLLGFAALTRTCDSPREASIHFRGATMLFRAHHESVCGCKRHRSCRSWSPFDPRCSEMKLVSRALAELGIPHRLLDAYKPEDEAARECRILNCYAMSHIRQHDVQGAVDRLVQQGNTEEQANKAVRGQLRRR